MDLRSGLGLFGFVAACCIAASSGAYFRPGEWHRRLVKPWWSPPDWVFPPAWTILFITIAISGWLVWRRAGFSGAGGALAIYFVSLGLNAAWSGLFFGLHRPDLAFFEVTLLWLSIAGMVLSFYSIEREASLLLIPYLCWVTFAATLNFTLWRLNPVSGPSASS